MAENILLDNTRRAVESIQAEIEMIKDDLTKLETRKQELNGQLIAKQRILLLAEDPPTWKNTMKGCSGPSLNVFTDAASSARKFGYKYLLWNDRVYLVGQGGKIDARGTSFLRGFLDKDGSKEFDNQPEVE